MKSAGQLKDIYRNWLANRKRKNDTEIAKYLFFAQVLNRLQKECQIPEKRFWDLVADWDTA